MNTHVTPDLQCDLVMKGGIASGIVYPLAACELARHYRLRCVGGASAGAIAAAATAAAEYGRASGGFDRLADLPDELAREDRSGETLLFRLFRPQPRTRALFRFLTAGLMPDRLRRLSAAARWFIAAVVNFPLWTIFGLVLGAGLVTLVRGGLDAATRVDAGMIASVVIVFVALILALVAGIGWQLWRRLPPNGYGICSGMGADDALTPWLYRTTQHLASRGDDTPLTFGDLWQGPAGIVGDESSYAQDPAINLQLMTTALSHGRPYTFPLETNDFFFDRDEMARYFPPVVVEWMCAHPRAVDPNDVMDGYCPLPEMEHLPIIVPVRISLSFPVLLSALSLYRWRVVPDGSGGWTRERERVRLSDGGICSNFPIHLFDSTIPSRPTFGINLTDARYVPEGARSPQDYVFLPKHNNSGLIARAVEIEPGGRGNLVKFLGAILQTMHNWTDNTQLSVPGYRDRIAHVRLTKDEGGLNLRMGPALIRAVAERGEYAARQLAEHFVPQLAAQPAKTDWRNHRWVRYRAAMRLFEDALARIAAAEAATGNTPAALLPMHAKPPSYAFKTARQRAAAEKAYGELLAVAQGWDGARAALGHPIFARDDDDGPRPRPELRIRPRL